MPIRAVTTNVTSFANAKGWIPTVQAHIILLQEHRIIAEEDIEEASHWCKKTSYISLWAPAIRTWTSREAQRWSGHIGQRAVWAFRPTCCRPYVF